MHREEIYFPEKDLPLRRDVSELGALVGNVIGEQGGAALFQAVENARRAAIARREEKGGAEERLEAVVGSLPPREAEELVRAFCTYFRVVNLAERVHRIRRRRDYLREQKPQPGGIDDALLRMQRSGVSAPQVEAILKATCIEPVFTAHPSEATRRTLLEKQQRMARALAERFDPTLPRREQEAILARLRAEIASGWQTEEHPSERPTVADELEHVLFYVTDVLYRVVPVFYESLEAALQDAYGEPVSVPCLLRFASWVGGDMDGNPYVDAASIRSTLRRHRALVLGLYRGEALDLARRLSQSLPRVSVDDALLSRVATRTAEFPEIEVRPRHRNMPYRVFFQLAAAKLAATGRDEERGYPSPEAFLEDLRAVAASLEHHRGAHAGLFGVRRLLRRAETFGFHLATLDVRQNAAVFRSVLAKGLADPEWERRPAAERAEVLRRALAETRPCAAADDEEVRATLDVFRAIGEGRARYGARAIGPCIVSMTQDADDLWSVLLLARWAGLGGAGAPVPIDAAPLFETVPDLRAAPRVMAALLRDEAYREHLRARGDLQVVMIGYSDSNKDGGLGAARWALHRAQEELVAAFSGTGVEMVVFHGRGGTISRGGGKTQRAILGAPAGSVHGRIRVTEQGEMIHERYGLRGIAVRTLEQTAGAVLERGLAGERADGREPAWRKIAETIARESRRRYRALVYDDPGFLRYFRQATPIDVIERMAIGSRPPSRKKGGGIEDLRAIPWVFSWTQSRHLLPGWYGLGSGLSAAVGEFGEPAVAEMAREWPFLRMLFDDAEMVLAKTDLAIASHYARLAGDYGLEVFARIREEFERTKRMVLSLQGTRELLDEDFALQRSIRLRNPYVDPMSALQVQLLRRWRETDRRDDDLLRALIATVNGIAQGLQNTG